MTLLSPTAGAPAPGPWKRPRPPHLLCQGLGFLLCVAHAHQVPVSYVVHAVAGGAHLLVHLETPPDAKERHRVRGSEGSAPPSPPRNAPRQPAAHLVWSREERRPRWDHG